MMLPRRRPLSRLVEVVRTLTRVWHPTDAAAERPADSAARPSNAAADPSLSWVADPDGAPDHWLRRIREASLPPAAHPGRHQVGRAVPGQPEHVGPDPGDGSRPVPPAARHPAARHPAARHSSGGDPAAGPTHVDAASGVPPAPYGDTRRGAPSGREARSDSRRPEPTLPPDAPLRVGSDRGVADPVAATRPAERPTARLRLRRSDTPAATPPRTPPPTRDADVRGTDTGVPRRIVLRTPGAPSLSTPSPAPSPAVPGGAVSHASPAPNADDGDRAPAATPHTRPTRTAPVPAPASPTGAPRGTVGIRAHGIWGEPRPESYTSPAAAGRGPAHDASLPDRSPRSSPTESRALAAVAPAATHPWPELSSPRPLTVSGASAESVIREVARARRLAAEQASV